LPPASLNDFKLASELYIHNIYGLTESASPTPRHSAWARRAVARLRALSRSASVQTGDAKVIDLEDPDKEMPPGERAELALKGPMIFPAIGTSRPKPSAPFTMDTFTPATSAIMDENGWFLPGGPQERYDHRFGIPSLAREVRIRCISIPRTEAAVIGVPDSYRGETVKAFVALKQDCVGRVQEAEIIQFCRSVWRPQISARRGVRRRDPEDGDGTSSSPPVAGRLSQS